MAVVMGIMSNNAPKTKTVVPRFIVVLLFVFSYGLIRDVKSVGIFNATKTNF